MTTEANGHLNVLVVDDEPVARDVLVSIINREEHQAVPAGSAEEILKLLPYWTFHVAFIDHNLPGIEGLMLGEFLRRNNPDMSIALVTGMPDPSLERRAEDLGIIFIPKPFGVLDILRVIDVYKKTAEQREVERQQQFDDEYAPPFSRYADVLADCYALPHVPSRVEGRLIETVKRSLNNLRSPHRYNEKDRVVALAGLISARVLGIRLPKGESDQTLYREYDELMRRRGRRSEFETD